MPEDLPPTPLSTALCPVCGATDAYVQPLSHRDMVFVECVNCRVYIAERKAFRHYAYLRGKGEAAGLRRLQALAQLLHTRDRGSAMKLEFDTWEQLISSTSEPLTG